MSYRAYSCPCGRTFARIAVPRSTPPSCATGWQRAEKNLALSVCRRPLAVLALGLRSPRARQLLRFGDLGWRHSGGDVVAVLYGARVS